jgi:hypothetical protein
MSDLDTVSELLSTMVTPVEKRLAELAATNESVSLSQYVRHLVRKDLAERGFLRRGLSPATIETPGHVH